MKKKTMQEDKGAILRRNRALADKWAALVKKEGPWRPELTDEEAVAEVRAARKRGGRQKRM